MILLPSSSDRVPLVSPGEGEHPRQDGEPRHLLLLQAGECSEVGMNDCIPLVCHGILGLHSICSILTEQENSLKLLFKKLAKS